MSVIRRIRPLHPSVLVALALAILTAAALFWPREPGQGRRGTLLAFLPVADAQRREALDELADFLGREARIDLQLEVAGDLAAYRDGLADALVTLGPDGPTLALPAASRQALAVGRRQVPWNLRPSAVLVSRRGAPGGPAPWRSVPERTVFGDSLSLVCLAPLCDGQDAATLPVAVGWGRDPYDHRDVLVAAASGAYDHAVVRQWDAEAALAAGRLDPDRWEIRTVSDPVPDLVVLASRRLSAAVRLDLQQALTVIGRDLTETTVAARLVQLEMGRLGLEGFNPIWGPDFDRLRRRYSGCWPRLAD